MPRASFPAVRPLVRRRRGQRAFTIAEVMMATLVLAFGITTSLVAMQMGFRNIDLARGTTLAAQIMQSEMEALRMKSYAKIQLLDATETFSATRYFTGSSHIAEKFEVTRTITDDATYGSDVKNITVKVEWSSIGGRKHTRSFTALYARNGLYDYYYTVAHP